MPLMAVAYPIPAGRLAQWRAFIDELNGPRRAEFTESRRKAGVRERTFLQPTPMGDLVIVTLEGDDPGAAFAKMMGAGDAFTAWFLEQANAIHGIDLAAPMTEAPSHLAIDSE